MSVYGDDSMWRLIEHYGMNTAKPQLTWEEFEKLKAKDASDDIREIIGFSPPPPLKITFHRDTQDANSSMTEYFPSQLEAESARITRIAHGMTDGQDANSYLNERVSQLKAELAEAKELITSYQIAKDNLELKLIQKYVDAHDGMMPSGQPIPVQVY